MAIDLREIVGAMGGEIGERFVHRKLADHLREEIAKGKSSHDVVAQAIIRLRNSELLQTVQGILGPRALGLGLTGLGAGIVKLLQSVNVDGLLPGDQSVAMREVRFILKSLLPALIVGAAEGAGDTFEEDVLTAVAKLRSNTSVPEAQKPGDLDVVAYMNGRGTEPAEVFVYEGDPSRVDNLGLPCCRGAKFQRIKQERVASVKRTKTATIPGQKQKDGKDGPSRTIEVDLTDDEYRKACLLALNIESLPIGDAIRRLDFTGTDPATIDLLMTRTEPKDPPAPKKVEVNEDGLLLQRLLSLKAQDMSHLDQQVVIDLTKDIANDPSKVNQLAAQFLTDENRASGLSTEEFHAIITHMQMWLGSTLEFTNKMRLGFHRAKHLFDNAKDPATGVLLATGVRFEMAVGAFAQTIGKIVLGSAIGLTALFAMLLGTVILGAFGVSLDRPLIATNFDWLRIVPSLLFFTLAWYFKGWIRYVLVVLGVTTGIPGVIFLTANVMERLTPKEFAIALVAGGGFLACVELLLFTIIQGLLSIVMQFFPNHHKDWLVNKGRILIMFIAIHVGIFMILLFLNAPLELRLLICVSTFFALASQMGLSGYEFGDEARERARKTLRLFSGLTIIVFIAVIMTLVCQLNGKSLGDVIEWVARTRIAQSILILMGVGFVVAKVVRRMEEIKRTTTNGMPTEIDYHANWWLRGVAALFVLALASWPWVGSDINAHFEEKKPTSSFTNWFTQAVTPAVSQPTVVQPTIQSPAPVNKPTPQPVSSSRTNRSHVKPRTFDMANCQNISYDHQKEMGCP